MDSKKCLALFVFILFSVLVSSAVFAEDAAVSAVETSAVVTPVMAPVQNEVNPQWLWGEVVNLDPLLKTVTLKYLDYETDQEKEIVLVVNEKTTYENIKSFAEIKIKDTLSVDYLLEAGDKNIVKNISFEGSELAAPANNDLPVTAPESSAAQTVPAVKVQDAALPTAPADPTPTVESTPAGSEIVSPTALSTAPVEGQVVTPVTEQPAVGSAVEGASGVTASTAAPTQGQTE